MTFEEWKEKHNDLIENVAITFFNYERGVDTKTCYDELEYLLQRAFKAGRPQWHDLRKDSNDLPLKMGIGSEVVLISYDGEVTDFAYYNFEAKRWEHDEDVFLYL